MIYRTPSQQLPVLSSKELMEGIAAGLEPPEHLPYGLDIWDDRIKKKVLNIEWDDLGRTDLIRFQRGDWEKKVVSWLPHH